MLFMGFAIYLSLNNFSDVEDEDDGSGAARKINSNSNIIILMVFNAILGCCLMGALPLLLLDSIYAVNHLDKGIYTNHPDVGENVVNGIVYFQAIALAAVLTTLVSHLSGTTSLLIVGCLLLMLTLALKIMDNEERKQQESGSQYEKF